MELSAIQKALQRKTEIFFADPLHADAAIHLDGQQYISFCPKREQPSGRFSGYLL